MQFKELFLALRQATNQDEVYNKLYQFCEITATTNFIRNAVNEDVTAIIGLLQQDYSYEIYYLLLNILCDIYALGDKKATFVKLNGMEQLVSLLKKCMAVKHFENSIKHELCLMVLEITAQFLQFLSCDAIQSQARVAQITCGVIEVFCDLLSLNSIVYLGYGSQDYMEQAILRKHLIGRVVNSSTLPCHEVAKRLGKPMSEAEVASCTIDLYDTSRNFELRFVDDMRQRGLLVFSDPQAAIPSSVTAIELWQDIYPTHVIDAVSFWAVVGTERFALWKKIQSKVLIYLETSDPARCPNIRIDDVCLTKMCNVSNNDDYVRCRVIVSTGHDAEVFALDYGCVSTVAVTSLYPLPQRHELATTPATVTLCTLHGE